MDYTIGSLIFFSGFVTGVAAGIIGGLKLMAWGMKRGWYVGLKD